MATEEGGVRGEEELAFYIFRQIAIKELPTGGSGEAVIVLQFSLLRVILVLGVAGEVTYDTGLGLMLDWSF